MAEPLAVYIEGAVCQNAVCIGLFRKSLQKPPVACIYLVSESPIENTDAWYLGNLVLTEDAPEQGSCQFLGFIALDSKK